jgi:biopolymer transport protein ExbD
MPFPHKVKRQHGVVAIIFVLALTAVFGFMGIAVDLAQTYEMKTELQNAADAAALSGAKELVGTQAGITAAVAKAKATAQLNRYKYSKPLILEDQNIRFGDHPDTDTWKTFAEAYAQPTGLLFIKVDTGLKAQDIASFMKVVDFMRPAGAKSISLSTFGSAVAGRFALSITPIAACALDPLNKFGKLDHPGPPALPPELTEFGYRRGLAYDILNINPLGAAPNKYLLNPIDIAKNENDNTCNPNNGSTKSVGPFICNGTASLITTLPGYAFVDTGFKSTLDAELNSRFLGNKSCAVPEDTNIHEYIAGNNSTGMPNKWMTPDTTAANQSLKLITSGKNPNTITLPFTGNATGPGDWGVVWSYSRAVQWAATPPAGGYTPYSTADWPSLYPTPVGGPMTAKSTYPSSTALGGNPSPYNQGSASDFFKPGSGSRDRRVINVALANCSTLKSNGKCNTIQILGVGRFFMPVKANTPTNLHLEFAGLIPDSTLTAEIKLYR